MWRESTSIGSYLKGFWGGRFINKTESKKGAKKKTRHYTGLTLDSFSLLVLNLDNNLWASQNAFKGGDKKNTFFTSSHLFLPIFPRRPVRGSFPSSVISPSRVFGAGTTAAGAETTAVDDRAGESRSRVNQAEKFKGVNRKLNLDGVKRIHICDRGIGYPQG